MPATQPRVGRTTPPAVAATGTQQGQVNSDRVYRMWRAQRKRRAKDGLGVTGAAFDVARCFGISCAEVRRIVQETRAARAANRA